MVDVSHPWHVPQRLRTWLSSYLYQDSLIAMCRALLIIAQPGCTECRSLRLPLVLTILRKDESGNSRVQLPRLG
jgi:hypothetical protein